MDIEYPEMLYLGLSWIELDLRGHNPFRSSAFDPDPGQLSHYSLNTSRPTKQISQGKRYAVG